MSGGIPPIMYPASFRFRWGIEKASGTRPDAFELHLCLNTIHLPPKSIKGAECFFN